MFSTVEWTDASLADLGRSLGLDAAKLREDAESPEIAALLSSYKAIGRHAGVTGTPAFAAE